MAESEPPAQDGLEQAGDWHPADVEAAIKKRGLTLSAVSLKHGYHPTAAGKALRSPWPALERVIADALGLLPQAIWPSRYDRNGISRRQSMRRPAPSGWHSDLAE